MFDQTCLNRLATQFNIIMFGHRTMFDDVRSPNISCLDRPLGPSVEPLIYCSTEAVLYQLNYQAN